MASIDSDDQREGEIVSSSSSSSSRNHEFPLVVELSVGGVNYTTAHTTLTKHPGSLLERMFGGPPDGVYRMQTDDEGRYVIDADGVLFRYVLDYLRDDVVVLPSGFCQYGKLLQEAEYLKLPQMAQSVIIMAMRDVHSGCSINPELHSSCCITISYRGTFASGLDGSHTQVKFRKLLSRIVVCGQVSVCRDVFGELLNDSRDPDLESSGRRHSFRLFLRCTSLEKAFDRLLAKGFRFLGCCSSGTAYCVGTGRSNGIKHGADIDNYRKLNHYNEFVFYCCMPRT